MQKPTKLQHLAERRSDLVHLHLDRFVIVEGFNVRQRFDTPEDEALYHYVVQGGELPPTIGRRVGDTVHLTDGHRRLLACRRARDEHGERDEAGNLQPWMTLPFLPEAKGATEADRIVRMVAANNGKPLTMLEQAHAYHRYRQQVAPTDPAAATNEAMARRFGCSHTHIGDCKVLIEGASPALRHALDEGEIPATLAVTLIRRADDLAEQETLLIAARTAAVAAGSDTITAKHFGKSLSSRKKTRAKPEAVPPVTKTTIQPGYAYDSAEEGDYDVDPEDEGDGEEGNDAANDETPTPHGDPTCPDCGAILAVTDRANPSGKCYRCAPTKEIQPDSEGGGASQSVTHASDPHYSGSGGGTREHAVGAATGTASSPGQPDAPWEPPVTLDETFFIDLLETTKDLATTGRNDRRQTLAYLRAHLQKEGGIRRHHLIQWIRTGQVDP